ncbi:hypothetical protein B0H10DRAFT_1964358 [Mycena sp. CBHHK59/15]|nr:hypothetical protein B0H10DRAFT_1964358 [Mycena sp. CBHHK59/15]
MPLVASIPSACLNFKPPCANVGPSFESWEWQHHAVPFELQREPHQPWQRARVLHAQHHEVCEEQQGDWWAVACGWIGAVCSVHQHGALVILHKNGGHFSIDNWGNVSTWDDNRKIKKICCATFFCATLTRWDDGKWQQLRAAAGEWVEKKKQAITLSCATSEAKDLVEEEGKEDVIIVSN